MAKSLPLSGDRYLAIMSKWVGAYLATDMVAASEYRTPRNKEDGNAYLLGEATAEVPDYRCDI